MNEQDQRQFSPFHYGRPRPRPYYPYYPFFPFLTPYYPPYYPPYYYPAPYYPPYPPYAPYPPYPYPYRPEEDTRSDLGLTPAVGMFEDSEVNEDYSSDEE